MKAGTRYENLRSTLVREEPLVTVPRDWDELELQAHWFAGDFGREFSTTTGQPVRIVQFGVWNREAGPDFADAAVSFGDGEAVRGCIEIDIEARDWERHGHATNADYEPVVLHIFTRPGGAEFFTRTAEHRLVPQVLLDPTQLNGDLAPSLPEARLGRCSGPLRDLPDDKAYEILFGAAQFRLRRKAGMLSRLAELHGPDEALFQALAATLGYKSNKLPFTLLAQRLPLRLLRKNDAGALLFGVSGFLPHDLTAFESSTRTYLRGLWENWWPRRAEFDRLKIAPAQWRMSGQRPANHPQRRLAALAQMVRLWPKIRVLADRAEATAIHEFFAGLKDEYWDCMFTYRHTMLIFRMLRISPSKNSESKNGNKNRCTDVSGQIMMSEDVKTQRPRVKRRMWKRNRACRSKMPTIVSVDADARDLRHPKIAIFRSSSIH